MKKLLPILIVIVLAALAVYKLLDNRDAIQKAASLAEAGVAVRPVRIMEVTSGSRVFEDVLPGLFSAESELMVTAATQGRVREVFVRKGQWVDIGAPLAQVEDELLREQYEVAKQAYEKLLKDKERFRIMKEQEAVTGRQEEELELNFRSAEARYLAARKQWEETVIKSPASGYVNQLFIKAGGMAAPGVPVCEIVNTRKLVVKLKVSQGEMEQVVGATRLGVVPSGMSGDTLSGTILFRSLKPDYAQQYDVEIALDESPETLGAGMSAEVVLKTIAAPGEIYVPRDALLGFGSRSRFVYVVSGEQAERRDVQTGTQRNGWVQITDGLKEGDRLIIEGQNMIEDGQTIKIIP